MCHSFKLRVLAGLIISLIALSSCGQKKSLYLPEKPETNNPTSDVQESSEGNK
ncbi:lipoprotein [Paraglaciecola aquimarina]|uniref:Lipoprotein n=1 Tax=Paraglaciecola aquimarina TaxID=1235557 RepID=A0ABU3ST43_9ALTE|nr:lipoprotein [Paraglaciecola aquimarina]MDU0353152.1 lipoprotein [Paraglaciecola aquimarina]